MIPRDREKERNLVGRRPVGRPVGRPPKSGSRKAGEQTAISVPVQVRDALNVYRRDLSEVLGIDLTVAQALKYLIKHATVPRVET